MNTDSIYIQVNPVTSVDLLTPNCYNTSVDLLTPLLTTDCRTIFKTAGPSSRNDYCILLFAYSQEVTVSTAPSSHCLSGAPMLDRYHGSLVTTSIRLKPGLTIHQLLRSSHFSPSQIHLCFFVGALFRRLPTCIRPCWNCPAQSQPCWNCPAQSQEVIPDVSETRRPTPPVVEEGGSGTFTTTRQNKVRQKLICDVKSDGRPTTESIIPDNHPAFPQGTETTMAYGNNRRGNYQTHQPSHTSATATRSRQQTTTTLTRSRPSISRTRASSSRSQVTTVSIATSPDPSPTSFYNDLGDCKHVCQYCGATFWYEERSKQYYRDGEIHYNKCCSVGKVSLPMPPDPPEYIKGLLTDPHFMANIRAYNSMFSMTSFGASVDETINSRSGPYVFRLCGQIYHWIGTLCPPPLGDSPKFLRLYICDTSNGARNRLSHFGGEHITPLKPEIVDGLITFLDEHNHLVKLFRTARDKCLAHDIPEFHIRLFNKPKNRQYELPTDGLGAIVFETGPKTQNDYDVIIHSKEGSSQRINKLHPAYMSMQFSLLFLYGEPGYQQELKLINPTTRAIDSSRRLTIKMFYSFQLHDRFEKYSVILRGGRLFQQYIVNAWLSIEQCRLDYIQEKQSDIRSEYLQGIHDALVRGDHDGSDVGLRVILPSSFVGGPRYMYKHYQDALAICRVHGNPQFFVTFTCNIKWPEIKGYMLRFPLIKAQDRPDIVSRIFDMKVKELVKFVKEHIPLGDIVADLYTIEFQKRGLPHCHLLLWPTPETKTKSPEEIDRFISAEIPDESLDPEGYKVVSEFMMHGPCGLAKIDAPCMEDTTCSKSFPKQYVQNTYFDDKGFVHYRRRDTGAHVTKYNRQLDNSYVV